MKYVQYALRFKNGMHICDSCPVGLCDMKEYDTKCGRVCGCMSMLARDIEKANEIILNWCKEHSDNVIREMNPTRAIPLGRVDGADLEALHDE